MRKLMAVCVAATLLPAAAFAGDDMMITGYVDGGFQAIQQLDATTADPTDTTWKTSFGDASQALFWVTGSPAENASYTAEINYWQASNTLQLNQAMIDWKVAGDMFALSFGKFYIPFGIEARSSYSSTNKLVTRPMMTQPTDNGVDFHGMMDTGNGISWKWDAAVTNGFAGAGLGSQLTDANNNNKSVTGRLEVMPMEQKLNIGGSAAFGAWDAAGNNNYMLLGGHAIVDYMEGLDIRGEFLWQQLKDVAPTVDLTSMGFYAQGAYRLPVEGWNWVEPVVRFAWMDPNTDVDNDAGSQIAVGIGFSPVEHFTLKGEFDINSEQGTSVDNNQIGLQAVYGW
jgi:hypothetical protein